MDRQEIYADVRRKIGGLGLNEVTDKELEPYVAGALEWLAAELRYRVQTTTMAISLTASQQEYPWPSDLVEIIFLEHNAKRLAPASVFGWDRVGTDWRNAAAGTPLEFAVQGRKFILNPPPSADAITTDGTLTLRGVFAPIALSAGGPDDLPPLDHRLAAWEAAREWLLTHPTNENIARAQSYGPQIAMLLRGARRLSQRPIRDYEPRFRVRPYRQGAAG